jgi:hypothetical protein
MSGKHVAAEIDVDLAGRVRIDVGLDHHQPVDQPLSIGLQSAKRRSGGVRRAGGDHQRVVRPKCFPIAPTTILTMPDTPLISC